MLSLPVRDSIRSPPTPQKLSNDSPGPAGHDKPVLADPPGAIDTQIDGNPAPERDVFGFASTLPARTDARRLAARIVMGAAIGDFAAVAAAVAIL
jgi:hypothetical protein